MGREARAEVTLGESAGAARLHLDSQDLVLSGAVRARLPRASLRAVRAENGILHAETDRGPLAAALGPLAPAWAKAILTPPPDLARKLGLGPDRRGWLLWPATDVELAAAIAAHPAAGPEAAACILAELADAAAAARALDRLSDLPPLPFWGVTRKGPASPFGEDALRALLRGAGWIDSKTCAVSARWSATRYGLRR